MIILDRNTEFDRDIFKINNTYFRIGSIKIYNSEGIVCDFENIKFLNTYRNVKRSDIKQIVFDIPLKYKDVNINFNRSDAYLVHTYSNCYCLYIHESYFKLIKIGEDKCINEFNDMYVTTMYKTSIFALLKGKNEVLSEYTIELKNNKCIKV